MQKSKTRDISKLLSKEIGENLSKLNTTNIIGEPIVTLDGVTVIPVSKMTLGFLNGGGEYGETTIFKKDGKQFAGGNGAVVNMCPHGFLVINKGRCRFLKTRDDLIDNVFEKTTQILEQTINE